MSCEISCKLVMPNNIKNIIEKLENHGYEAYAIGGCVRDCIMGKIPYDWDITTSATPHQVKQVFDKTFDTGIKHGTVTVLYEEGSYEVTTFRADGEYLDGRHPENVEFTMSLFEDTCRRDFTMNAMAWHPQKGIIDFHDGIGDILNKRIRTVGDAEKRFNEDALRMLRAVRFAAQLGFSIDDYVIDAIRNCSARIMQVSYERIRDELTKMLLSQNPIKLILLRDTYLLQYILPEFELCFHTEQNHPYHIYNVAIHTLQSVANIDSDFILRWTMLLHDLGKPLTRTTDEKGIDHFHGHIEQSIKLSNNIMNRFKFDNKSKNTIEKLIKYHDKDIIATPKAIRKLVSEAGVELYLSILKVHEADTRAQNMQLSGKNLNVLKQASEEFQKIINEKNCLSINELSIDGNDLIEIGVEKGPKVGQILHKLLEMVIEEPNLNDKRKLLDISKNYI